MDPMGNWAQDVLRCDLCKQPGPPMYCDICYIYLCTPCVKEHIFDDSTEHKVVPIEMRGSTSLCRIHALKICEQYCQPCKIPICKKCASSIEHKDHELVEILKAIESRKSVLERDLQELENCIYPKYHEIASYFAHQMANLSKHSKKLISAIDEHGEELPREIDFAIEKLKSDLNEKDSKYLAVLKNHEDEITCTILDIKQSIDKVRKLLISNDVYLVSAYKSRNAEYRKLPPTLIVTVPSFTPQEIAKEHIYQQLGSLSGLSVKTEEYGYTMDSSDAESSPADRSLIVVPKIIKEIKTEYKEYKLSSVSCFNDDNIWTCGGDDEVMRLYNLQGELVRSIQTKSRNGPTDIAVTPSGGLLYTDYQNKTVNQVRDRKIRSIISLYPWKPLSVCRTSSGDLLVVMDSKNNNATQVVQYNGSTEKHRFYYDKKKSLCSSSENVFKKYITENRNLDICLSDCEDQAVVVINQAGKLRFTYTGSHCSTKELFIPLGITTDSQSQIITADFGSDCIHILDQDGQFLRYIDNCSLSSPYGLCVDTSDSLFVAENGTGKVKKIQYNRSQKCLVDYQTYRPIELVILSNCTKL